MCHVEWGPGSILDGFDRWLLQWDQNPNQGCSIWTVSLRERQWSRDLFHVQQVYYITKFSFRPAFERANLRALRKKKLDLRCRFECMPHPSADVGDFDKPMNLQSKTSAFPRRPAFNLSLNCRRHFGFCVRKKRTFSEGRLAGHFIWEKVKVTQTSQVAKPYVIEHSATQMFRSRTCCRFKSLSEAQMDYNQGGGRQSDEFTLILVKKESGKLPS